MRMYGCTRSVCIVLLLQVSGSTCRLLSPDQAELTRLRTTPMKAGQLLLELVRAGINLMPVNEDALLAADHERPSVLAPKVRLCAFMHACAYVYVLVCLCCERLPTRVLGLHARFFSPACHCAYFQRCRHFPLRICTFTSRSHLACVCACVLVTAHGLGVSCVPRRGATSRIVFDCWQPLEPDVHQ